MLPLDPPSQWNRNSPSEASLCIDGQRRSKVASIMSKDRETPLTIASIDKEPPLTEPQTVECEYVSGADCYLSEDGQTVVTIAWISCPILSERRVTLRAASSRAAAEKYCRELMRVLGIREGDH
jgi:hypothetical protein